MKIVKKANGQLKLKVSKNEWLKLGQELGVSPELLEDKGALTPAPTVEEDPFAESEIPDPTDSPVEEVGTSTGEDPELKLRRLLGELQSVVDELFPETPEVDETLPVEGELEVPEVPDEAEVDLTEDPADKAL